MEQKKEITSANLGQVVTIDYQRGESRDTTGLWLQQWGRVLRPAKGKALTRIGKHYGMKRKYWGLERDVSFRLRLLAFIRTGMA